MLRKIDLLNQLLKAQKLMYKELSAQYDEQFNISTKAEAEMGKLMSKLTVADNKLEELQSEINQYN